MTTTEMKPRAQGTDRATEGPLGDVRIPRDSPWFGAWKVAGVVGSAALTASAYGARLDARRFAFSYLFALVAVLTVALGALFFVLLQHLTGAAWSVTVRRSSEFLMRGLIVFVALVVPLLACTRQLYPWDGSLRVEVTAQSGAFANGMDEGNREPLALAAANRDLGPRLEAARALEDRRLFEGRHPYMNRAFFTARALAFVGAWALLAWGLFRWSTQQDVVRGVGFTLLSRRVAPVGAVVFAVTVVLASIDWVMSLEPRWYSTIFGLYFFADCTAAHAGALILLLLLLQEAGFMRRAVTVEHYHDLGKLLFGWLSFWAYIAFAQFFLIWYANLPEEVSFFHERWDDQGGSFKAMTCALMALHFLVPFWLLLSRSVKRSAVGLALGSVLILVAHLLDVYWLVMPNEGPLEVHWLDATCLLGVSGIYLAAVLRSMRAHPLVPIGDPRLGRALAFEET